MSDQVSNKPVTELRDGKLRAVIWANATGQGIRHNVELIRSYKAEDGNWHDTHTFSNGELLRISHLANKAYDRVCELRAEQKQDAPEPAAK